MGWNFIGLPGRPSETSLTAEEYLAAVNAAAEQRRAQAQQEAAQGFITQGSLGAAIAANAAARQPRPCAPCRSPRNSGECICTEPCDSGYCAAIAPPDRPGDVHLAVPVPRFQ